MDDTCLYIQLHLNHALGGGGGGEDFSLYSSINDTSNSSSGLLRSSNASSTLFLSSFLLATTSYAQQFDSSMTSPTSVMTYAADGAALTSSHVKDYLYGVVNPLLAACGILGNLLSIIVLTQRRMQRAMDHSGMERAARLGLIALAVSDILFCVSTLPKAFVGSETLFAGLSLRLYVQIYGPCLERIFMRTSTWLTVIMAVSRFAAICHPLKTRHLVGPAFTGAAILATFIVWTLLHIPLFWMYEIVPVPCDNGQGGQHVYYVLDQGYFAKQETLHKAFTYLWSVLGYVIPVAVLTYCNVHLIGALRESRRVRRQYRVHVGRVSNAPGPGVKITPTLVAIVCMLIILVSPAELVNFYYYAVEGTSVENFNVVMVATNVLVTMNFGLNFVLYCIVNVQFRKAARRVCHCHRLCGSPPPTLVGEGGGGGGTGGGGGGGGHSTSASLHEATLACPSYQHMRICTKLSSARVPPECIL